MPLWPAGISGARWRTATASLAPNSDVVGSTGTRSAKRTARRASTGAKASAPYFGAACAGARVIVGHLVLHTQAIGRGDRRPSIDVAVEGDLADDGTAGDGSHRLDAPDRGRHGRHRRASYTGPAAKPGSDAGHGADFHSRRQPHPSGIMD